MNLLIAKPYKRRHQLEEISDKPHHQLLDEVPVDFYQKYKDDDYLPRKGRSNSYNLFDDRDIEDYYWFNVARKYLRLKY